MILASVIEKRVLSRLDAEDSDRYTFTQDICPAINGAMEDVVSVLNNAFADNKLKPEALRELSRVYVFEPSIYSRVSVEESVVGREIWSILAVFPDCKVNKKDATNSNNTDQSKVRKDISFIGGVNASKRLTIEQFTEAESNVFSAGSSIFSGQLINYAHLESTIYSAENSTFLGSEITIKPALKNKFVGVGFLLYPKQIVVNTDKLEFPKSLTEFFTELVLNKIAYKQGEAALIQITEAHVNKIVSYFK